MARRVPGVRLPARGWLVSCRRSAHAFSAARSVSEILSNRPRPSLPPRAASNRRSGCGIMPSMFFLLFVIPAILSLEPLGLYSLTHVPFDEAYLNTI